jgi:hypothetical protein
VNRLRWSERFRLAELDPTEHLFQKLAGYWPDRFRATWTSLPGKHCGVVVDRPHVFVGVRWRCCGSATHRSPTSAFTPVDCRRERRSLRRRQALHRSLCAAAAPWRRIPLPLEEGCWPDLYANADRGPDLPYWKFYPQFVTQPFPAEAIDLVIRYLANAPSPPSNFFCSTFGGAVRHAPPGGSAFPHRDALFYCEPGAAWDDPNLHAKALGWAADFWRALRPYGKAGDVNVPNAPSSDWEHEYYGPNVERLRQVKAKYDPENVFSFEQSVPPVAG